MTVALRPGSVKQDGRAGQRRPGARIPPPNPPTLVRVLDDPRIAVKAVGTFKPSPPSPLRTDVLQAIERVTSQLWPGVPVVPIMGTGATDSLYLRAAGTPMYGVSGIFGDIDDVRAHGRDERIGVRAFQEGREFLYRLVKELSAAGKEVRGW